MLTVEKLKIDLIKLITDIDDCDVLHSIRDTVQEFYEPPIIQGQNIAFQMGITTIREEVTTDAIFEEQGNKSITFEAINAMIEAVAWEVSLPEMLASID